MRIEKGTALACGTLSCLTALAFTPASAETNVRVFGIADSGIEISSAGQGTASRVISGGAAGSRWGLDAKEDLGHGLSATVRLVGGFTTDDGKSAQGGRLFGREAAVGLVHDTFGSILFGRQPTPVSLANSFVDAFYWMGSGAMTALTRSGATSQQVLPQVVTARADNTIKYYSPDAWKSFQLTALIAPGERSPELGSTYGVSARIGYGPLDINLAWGQQQSGSAPGAVGKMNAFVAGGSYDFRVAKLYIGFTDERNSCSSCTGTLARPADAAGVQAAAFRLINLGVRVPVGKFTAIAQVTRVNDRSRYRVDPGNRDAMWFAIGGEYAMSRRTVIYGSVATIDNRNGSQYVLGSGSMQQGLNAVGPANPRVTTGTLGIKHIF